MCEKKLRIDRNCHERCNSMIAQFLLRGDPLLVVTIDMCIYIYIYIYGILKGMCKP